MKLELKYILPYLSHGLSVQKEDGSIDKINGFLGTAVHLLNTNDSDRFYHLTQTKPILRPLSDLTKDEHFDMYMDLCEELGLTRCEHLLLALKDELYYAFDISKLELLEEFMYKNHFDWKYNLIDQNLAIDINTIKQ